MNKTRLSATLLAALAALATTGQANAADDGFYLSGGWNKFLFDSDKDLKDPNDGFVGLGYQYNPEMAVELMLNRGDTTDDQGMGIDTQFRLVSVSAVHRFSPQGESGFFGRAGLAYQLEKTLGNKNEEAATRLGAGYDYHLTENVALQGALDWVYGLEEQQSDFIPSIGLAFFFGGSPDMEEAVAMAEPEPEPEYTDTDGDGVIDERDQCPATPAGQSIDSQGCPLPVDSDGDGVMDNADACPDTPAGAKVDDKGCQLMLEKEVSITLHVTFPNNSTAISDAYRSEIGKVAEFMKAYPSTKATLVGYTDSVGSDAYNLALSKRRAKAVMDYLINEFGIDASRLSSDGRGEADPVADNRTAEGRAQNRRVDAKITAITKAPQ